MSDEKTEEFVLKIVYGKADLPSKVSEAVIEIAEKQEDKLKMTDATFASFRRNILSSKIDKLVEKYNKEYAVLKRILENIDSVQIKEGSSDITQQEKKMDNEIATLTNLMVNIKFEVEKAKQLAKPRALKVSWVDFIRERTLSLRKIRDKKAAEAESIAIMDAKKEAETQMTKYAATIKAAVNEKRAGNSANFDDIGKTSGIASRMMFSDEELHFMNKARRDIAARDAAKRKRADEEQERRLRQEAKEKLGPASEELIKKVRTGKDEVHDAFLKEAMLKEKSRPNQTTVEESKKGEVGTQYPIQQETSARQDSVHDGWLSIINHKENAKQKEEREKARNTAQHLECLEIIERSRNLRALQGERDFYWKAKDEELVRQFDSVIVRERKALMKLMGVEVSNKKPDKLPVVDDMQIDESKVEEERRVQRQKDVETAFLAPGADVRLKNLEDFAHFQALAETAKKEGNPVTAAELLAKQNDKAYMSLVYEQKIDPDIIKRLLEDPESIKKMQEWQKEKSRPVYKGPVATRSVVRPKKQTDIIDSSSDKKQGEEKPTLLEAEPVIKEPDEKEDKHVSRLMSEFSKQVVPAEVLLSRILSVYAQQEISAEKLAEILEVVLNNQSKLVAMVGQVDLKEPPKEVVKPQQPHEQIEQKKLVINGNAIETPAQNDKYVFVGGKRILASELEKPVPLVVLTNILIGEALKHFGETIVSPEHLTEIVGRILIEEAEKEEAKREQEIQKQINMARDKAALMAQTDFSMMSEAQRKEAVEKINAYVAREYADTENRINAFAARTKEEYAAAKQKLEAELQETLKSIHSGEVEVSKKTPDDNIAKSDDGLCIVVKVEKYTYCLSKGETPIKLPSAVLQRFKVNSLRTLENAQIDMKRELSQKKQELLKASGNDEEDSAKTEKNVLLDNGVVPPQNSDIYNAFMALSDPEFKAAANVAQTPEQREEQSKKLGERDGITSEPIAETPSSGVDEGPVKIK